jgi:hypothetical protein
MISIVLSNIHVIETIAVRKSQMPLNWPGTMQPDGTIPEICNSPYVFAPFLTDLALRVFAQLTPITSRTILMPASAASC